MKMLEKRKYACSFKERAVKMSYERDNIKVLASELGISAERLYKWRKEYKQYGAVSFQGQGNERLSDEDKRVKELEKKLRTTEMELEILKKAIAIFSQTDR